MKNKQLIENFIYGEKNGKGSNLKIQDKKLINYYTCIAYNGNYEIILNNASYSKTTKIHQNTILRSNCKLKIFDDENSFKNYIYANYNEVV